MEKLETRICKREATTHHFYCDDCNKYLGKSEEYDDGWYPELGEFKLEFYLPSCWHEVSKCLCDECRQKFLQKVEKILVELGFEKQ
jgi:hypothetical protein